MKFRWLIFDFDYLVTGTNDEKTAMMAAEEEMVYDVQEGTFLGKPSQMDAPVAIEEQETYIPGA